MTACSSSRLSLFSSPRVTATEAVFGDMPEKIARELDGPLILTKRYTGHVRSWFQKFFGARKTMLD